MMPFRAEVRSNVERLPDSQPRNATAEPFLVKDYELKVQYLTNHLSRMWTRFNYFVTIESALLGGKVAFGDGKLSPQLVVLGFFVSVIWYVMGAEGDLGATQWPSGKTWSTATRFTRATRASGVLC